MSNVSEEMKNNLTSFSMAHFPIRSQAQLSSKVNIGWLNVKSRPNISENHSWYWNDLHDKILTNQEIDMTDIAINYACTSTVEDKELIEDPLNLSS
ncbi:hypothetical protein ALNOE001_14930 [Candidatus Methanobinarius endosymbioticus]|uniref:Uncharacterized protein n=1 Tax=Candidatus Methanobinarius endosymbioticus TaxID=2006182 RepID=A0A366MAR0_9EURY|nr:hypothetical protein ALNOE001_14930 [Candidatus Methanobinarius endosymbioticus]